MTCGACRGRAGRTDQPPVPAVRTPPPWGPLPASGPVGIAPYRLPARPCIAWRLSARTGRRMTGFLARPAGSPEGSYMKVLHSSRPGQRLPTSCLSGPDLPAPWWLVRLALHVALASIPVLAISADVFGWISLRAVTIAVLLPTLVVTIIVVVRDPDRSDRVLLAGFGWGLLAC